MKEESMIELHPEVLSKNGKMEFVVLPYEEFVALQEILSDVQDLIELREAKEAEGGAATISLVDLKKRMGL